MTSTNTIAVNKFIQAQLYSPLVNSFINESDGKKQTEEERKQLSIGAKVEEEHKDLVATFKKYLDKKGIDMPMTSSEIYTMIAQAHLREIPDYYTRLDKMEKDAKKNAPKPKEKAPIKESDASEGSRNDEIHYYAGENSPHVERRLQKAIDQIEDQLSDILRDDIPGLVEELLTKEAVGDSEAKEEFGSLLERKLLQMLVTRLENRI